MIKTICKIGNSQGLIFDSALMQLAHLNVGDEVNVEVHPGGTITIAPISKLPAPEQVTDLIKSTMRDYAKTMQKLA